MADGKKLYNATIIGSCKVPVGNSNVHEYIHIVRDEQGNLHEVDSCFGDQGDKGAVYDCPGLSKNYTRFVANPKPFSVSVRSPIQAIEYKKDVGMEDGYDRHDAKECSHCQDTCSRFCNKMKPYIQTKSGKLFLDDGDFIVTVAGCERMVFSREEMWKVFQNK